MAVDVLLVNPNNRIASPFAGIEPPLWLGLLANDLKSQRKEVAVIDAEAKGWNVDRTVQEVRSYHPKEVLLVVMGTNPSVSSTPKMPVTKKLCENLKDLKVLVTGLHPSALPRETEEYLGVPVLKGKVFGGCPDIPFGLFPMSEYQAHVWHCLDGSPRSPYASTYTTLGCPYVCKFCNIHTLYDHHMYYRDVPKLIRELSLLHDVYKVRNIKFWDEMFTLNKERVRDICKRIIQTGFEFNIWAYARVDSVEPDLLKLMKKAGINWLAYGFESGSDKILNASHKKATVAKARQAVEWTHQVGINIIGNFMYGLPSDYIISMRETLEFAKSLNLEFVNMYACEPMVGSELYKGEDWTKFGQFNTNQTETKKFTDNAFKEFFTDQNYLDHIRNKFGEQSVKTIKDMLDFGKPKYV